MSQYDTYGLHDFLLHTPEAGLKKLLIDQKKMTEVHCNLLIKIVRAGDSSQFSEHFEAETMPKLRFGPAETKIKEKFWADCKATLMERGLLQPATQPKAA